MRLQRLLVSSQRFLCVGVCFFVVIYIYALVGRRVSLRQLNALLHSSELINAFHDADILNESMSEPPMLRTQEGVLRQKLVPPTLIPPRAWVKYPHRWFGLSLPVLTCKPLGRLGNVLGEYATLYALKRHYNVTAVMNRELNLKLRHTFPNISLPDMPAAAGPFTIADWTPVQNLGHLYNYAPIELAAAGLLGPKKFIIKGYPFEIQLFHHYRNEIRKEFTFSSTLTTKANVFLSSIKDKRSPELPPPVFISFHIRRTDYMKFFKNSFRGQLPEGAYFTRALSHYRTKFPGGAAAFVVASDDMKYARSQLAQYDDVFFSQGTSPEEDMALLSSCNHSIITLGSYGFWTAYLAGGEVVYADASVQNEYRFSRNMFEKVGLDFIPLPVD